jgi:hypothetical protein
LIKLHTLIVLAGLLLLVLGRAGAAETLCLAIDKGAATTHHPVSAGDPLKILFTHSIYGSHVEERFQINAASFESVDVRYSEPRLVEFYGYESAMRLGNWWVARPPRRQFQSLAVRASSHSSIRITFGNYTFSVADGAARISLGLCPSPNDG